VQQPAPDEDVVATDGTGPVVGEQGAPLGATAAPPPGQEADAGDAVPEAATLPIADYDSLAASQVVPRLASLDVAELEAVGAYERGKRARRTILNRVEQLLEQRRSTGA
jgi:hypothetical protein